MIAAVCSLLMSMSCEIVDDDPLKHEVEGNYVELSEVAQILAGIPIQHGHLQEVHDAVCSSSGNGYDEEYTMDMLFGSPGSGVGDLPGTRAAGNYERPLRELIQEHVLSTRSSDGIPHPQEWLDELMLSDIQIYWPYSQNWDGETFPIITFDPEDDSDVNVGYRLSVAEDGSRSYEEVLVDEKMALSTPVWVVNRNSDASYKTLELLRKENPDWGEGGGNIIIGPSSDDRPSGQPSTKVKDSVGSKCLILKNFKADRNYDCWFAGASEFFVKIGSVADFTASTEAELKLYNPSITDFMIVVRRGEVGYTLPFNVILVTDWTEQMTHCAFMVIEDDGGTWTQWKCTALVRVASKSYGIELSIPVRSWDDIVWRGRLSRDWLMTNNDRVNHFGDVDITFVLEDY